MFTDSERITRYSEKAGPGVPTIDAVETPLTASILTVCRRPFLAPAAAPLAAVNLADPPLDTATNLNRVRGWQKDPGKLSAKYIPPGNAKDSTKTKNGLMGENVAERGQGTSALAASRPAIDTGGAGGGCIGVKITPVSEAFCARHSAGAIGKRHNSHNRT